MKNKNKNWFYPLIILGVLLMLINSCKKDDDNNPTGQVPVLTTTTVSDITQTTASCGGNITSDGGTTVTARGVCWSTGQTPTISDSKTTDGTGAGSFTSVITSLTANTTYYVRAYATNSTGTGYGSAMSFTTLQVPQNTVIDIDGNVYNTVTIGSQVWMKENLKVTKYRNGDAIGTTSPATLDISGESTPKYQWAYDGNESNVASYGRLYTWYAVTDSRNICPTGWHVSTDDEWTTLTDYLTNNGYGYEGSGSDIAKSMAATSGWTTNVTLGTVGNDQTSNNSSGFTAFPSGLRYCIGPFYFIGGYGGWWTSTQWFGVPYYRYMFDFDSSLGWSVYTPDNGLSVRCIRD